MLNGMMRSIAALIKRKKTVIDFVSKRFDFLESHCWPIGMTASEASLSRRGQEIVRLYEQGTSKERAGMYLRRWLGWAGTGVVMAWCCMSAEGRTVGEWAGCGCEKGAVVVFEKYGVYLRINGGEEEKATERIIKLVEPGIIKVNIDEWNRWGTDVKYRKIEEELRSGDVLAIWWEFLKLKDERGVVVGELIGLDSKVMNYKIIKCKAKIEDVWEESWGKLIQKQE